MGDMADWILDNIMEDDNFKPYRRKKRLKRKKVKPKPADEGES